MNRYRWVALAGMLLVPAACSSSGTAGQPVSPVSPVSPAPTTQQTRSAEDTLPSTGSTLPASSSAPRSTTSASSSAARKVLAGMSEAERVGQLLMVDSPSSQIGGAAVTAIHSYHVGSVILDGNSDLSVMQTRSITDELQGDAPHGTKLFIATDQEGGLVRRLRGSGFDVIPSAVVQGRMDPATLTADAKRWGAELAQAGVNVDLAPVLDTVPSGQQSNPPIGDLDREYGRTPDVVSSHGIAVAQGLSAAGVDATVKHFPGLGRVSGNTDTTSGVTDSVTTADDAYLEPFADAVKAGVPFVMMSTAIYSKIDPGTPAAFSSKIVTGILRDSLGFDGVVISDDVGAAKQVGGYSPGERAVAFVSAGGDIVLTVDATQAPTMTSALLAKANSDPAFKAKVDAAALRVLQAKQQRGLLG